MHPLKQKVFKGIVGRSSSGFSRINLVRFKSEANYIVVAIQVNILEGETINLKISKQGNADYYDQDPFNLPNSSLIESNTDDSFSSTKTFVFGIDATEVEPSGTTEETSISLGEGSNKILYTLSRVHDAI